MLGFLQLVEWGLGILLALVVLLLLVPVLVRIVARAYYEERKRYLRSLLSRSRDPDAEEVPDDVEEERKRRIN